MSKKSSSKKKISSVGIFVSSWQVFVEHWTLLIPLAVLPVALDFTLLSTVFSEVRDYVYSQEVQSLSDLAAELPEDFMTYISISLIIGVIMAGAFISSLVLIIRDKKTVTLLTALRSGIDHFWELFTVGLVVAFLTVLGLTAVVIPGLVVALLMMFVFHARLEQELSIVESMKESIRIVRGNWRQVFYVILGVMAIALVADLTSRALSGSLSSVGTSGMVLLMTIPSSSFMAVVFTRAYLAFK